MINGRDHTAEAIARVKLYMSGVVRESREKIMLMTGIGIPEFQAAIEALNLTRHEYKWHKSWSMPTQTKEPNRINVMQVQAYVPGNFQPLRANSLAYKSIQSRGSGA